MGDHKYEASRYRCKFCGENYHTKGARDNCEEGHKSEARDE